jgi:ADP-ribose pyrophosphatase
MPDDARVFDDYELYSRSFFQMREGHLKYKKYSGEWSVKLRRPYFERGDSVAAIMHHPENDTIVLTGQFRYPAYVRDNNRAWLLEIPAGSVERDESPRETMSREIIEETGYESEVLHHIHTFFVSPGGTSERIHLYYARLDTDDPRHEGGGLDSEHEDIRVLNLPVDTALEKLHRGEILDAKSIIALQWLDLNRETLSTIGQPPHTTTRDND